MNQPNCLTYFSPIGPSSEAHMKKGDCLHVHYKYTKAVFKLYNIHFFQVKDVVVVYVMVFLASGYVVKLSLHKLGMKYWVIICWYLSYISSYCFWWRCVYIFVTWMHSSYRWRWSYGAKTCYTIILTQVSGTASYTWQLSSSLTIYTYYSSVQNI